MLRNIGKYKVLGELGSGGFSDVFLAENPVTKGKVAIKCSPERGVLMENLLHECQLLVELDHTNIVRIYDAEIIPPFFAIIMEYMAGGSLATKLHYTHKLGKTIAPDTAISIAKDVLSALEYAHSKRIIHRDIKPSNILFTAESHIKVSDFSIAKIMATSKPVTVASRIVGTVAYMAPEQLSGKVAFQTDIYAVGLLLYEMLTGLQPFFCENDYDMMKKIEHGDFPEPQRINPDIPDWLADIILRAMEGNLSLRFHSAKEMSLALGKGEASYSPLGDMEPPPLPDLVEVPDLEGKMLDEAHERTEELGLVLQVGAEEYNTNRPRGAIIQQKQEPGDAMTPGGIVEVVVSRGEAPDTKIESLETRYSSPRVSRLSRWLVAVVGSVILVLFIIIFILLFSLFRNNNSSSTELVSQSSGIISKQIQDGSQAVISAIKTHLIPPIVVSGNENEAIVPELNNLSLKDAENLLRSKGFEVVRESRLSKAQGNGPVIRQKPPKDTILQKNAGHFLAKTVSEEKWQEKVLEPAKTTQEWIPGHYEKVTTSTGLERRWVAAANKTTTIPAKTERMRIPAQYELLWVEKKTAAK